VTSAALKAKLAREAQEEEDARVAVRKVAQESLARMMKSLKEGCRPAEKRAGEDSKDFEEGSTTEDDEY
jgi:hypothetical protein